MAISSTYFFCNYQTASFLFQDSPAPKVPTVEVDKPPKLAIPKAPQTPSATPAKVMLISKFFHPTRLATALF